MGFHGFRVISAQSYHAAQDSSSRPSHPMISDISYTWWRCVTFIRESRVLKAAAGTFMTRCRILLWDTTFTGELVLSTYTNIAYAHP
jgi:hypothetical protein